MPPYRAIKEDWSDYDDESDLEIYEPEQERVPSSSAQNHVDDRSSDERRSDHAVERKVQEPIHEFLEHASSDESIDPTGRRSWREGRDLWYEQGPAENEDNRSQHSLQRKCQDGLPAKTEEWIELSGSDEEAPNIQDMAQEPVSRVEAAKSQTDDRKVYSVGALSLPQTRRPTYLLSDPPPRRACP